MRSFLLVVLLSIVVLGASLGGFQLGAFVFNTPCEPEPDAQEAKSGPVGAEVSTLAEGVFCLYGDPNLRVATSDSEFFGTDTDSKELRVIFENGKIAYVPLSSLQPCGPKLD